MAGSTERAAMGYAELYCRSSFSFLRAASQPAELVERAHALGYQALALTDLCSLAGVVRAHERARALGLRLLIGTELCPQDGPRLVLLASSQHGYRQLCALITRARRRADKGHYRLTRADLTEDLSDCLALYVEDPLTAPQPVDPPPAAFAASTDPAPPPEPLRWFAHTFAGRGWLAAILRRDGQDAERCRRLRAWAQVLGLPITAAGGVRMHDPARRPLLDVLTAIRQHTPVEQLGWQTARNAESSLRPLADLQALYPAAWLAESLQIAERCRFTLDALRYRYPDEVTPPAQTPAAYLHALVRQGMARRWPGGCPAAVQAQVRHELALIGELGYEPYFLTVWDIVRFARSRDILCQGRGSAANSAVCYCLGITEVDPARMNLLFERFISRERGEPPDIDVDFEHERREEVIQYIYQRYGRERAALAASVTTYRARSALRDVGKALGLEAGQIEQLLAAVAGWRRLGEVDAEAVREAGLDPANRRIAQVLRLANTLLGFPRHLSQHVGGFVIAAEPLSALVPVENAAMPERTIIQWDKDDLQALGMLKVDILALGMLSAIRRCLGLINAWQTRLAAPWAAAPPAQAAGYPASGPAAAQAPLTLAGVPAEDPAVYAMIQRADTVGVFQIESRAQMSMLPRLRPARFYDLVIEVAIVRPGPIQGDMVHPYLRRRRGEEPVSYPSAEVRAVLERTLGVPLFQEQVIKLATVAAGFSPGEADQLRRAMAAWKRHGGIEPYRERLLQGMRGRGYRADFAERLYRQIQGFGDYGFPESHAASFALLVYVSAWLKCHHPAAFCAALINSQPMGFYAPAQLVRDAREHGVTVLPADALHSAWDCTLEPAPVTAATTTIADADAASAPTPSAAAAASRTLPAVRLGLRLVKGLSRAGAERLVQARRAQPPADIAALARAAGLQRADLNALAAADALAGLGTHRHSARWAVAGVEPPLPLLGAMQPEAEPVLPTPSAGQQVLADYAQLGLSLHQHPLALLRPRLAQRGYLSAAEVALRPHGQVVWVAGLVLTRQRPGNGRAVFITLEDEAGSLNLIIWADLAERQRRITLGARLLGAWAEIQRAEGVTHLICRRLQDLSAWVGDLRAPARDFQ